MIARNQRGQSSLWAYAISGDLPIALVRIGDIQHIGLVRQLVQAHAYLRLKGLALDLIVWNEDRSGYRQVLHDDILGAVAALGATDLLDRPGGIFIRRTDQISEEDKVLLQTVARLIVVDTDGTLTEQLNRRQPIELPTQVFAGKGRPPEAALAPVAPVAPVGPMGPIGSAGAQGPRPAPADAAPGLVVALGLHGPLGSDLVAGVRGRLFFSCHQARARHAPGGAGTRQGPAPQRAGRGPALKGSQRMTLTIKKPEFTHHRCANLGTQE